MNKHFIFSAFSPDTPPMISVAQRSHIKASYSKEYKRVSCTTKQ